MSGAAIWFIGVLLLLPLGWLGGLHAGRLRDTARRSAVIGLVVVLLIGWAALIRHPSIAVHLIPLPALARLEGVGAAPLFVFILGVAWSHSPMRRQRAVMILGMLLGAGYFVQGGLWMMRPTPSNAFGRDDTELVVEQSQDYSCVPAACATSLRMLGVRTDETEMAGLTETRSGSGATLLRAMNGLSARLRGTDLQVQLLEPDYDELMRLEPPLLTPLRYEPTRLHMVTIVEVRPHLVLVADPATGLEFITRRRFEELYRGQVIAFEGGGTRADARQLLRQHTYILDPDQPNAVFQSAYRAASSEPVEEQVFVTGP